MEQTLDKSELQGIHAEEMEEIVGQPPGAIVRWGITVLFAIFLLLFSMSWIVEYPQILPAQFNLTSASLPSSVKAKSEGKIMNVNVKDGQQIKAGELLGHLETTADVQQVLEAERLLQTVAAELNIGQWHRLNNIRPARFTSLGELQSDFQFLAGDLIKLEPYFKANMYAQKVSVLQQEIGNLHVLDSMLKDQQEVHRRDYSIAENDFAAKSKLFDQKVIPLLEFKQEESRFLNKRLPVQNVGSQILSNVSTLSSKKLELLQFEQEVALMKSGFVQSLNTFLSKVDEWKKKYLLVAPVNGKIAFAHPVSTQQDVKVGEDIFFIAPPAGFLIAALRLEQNNFGKLHLGQEVLISLAGFPYQEFGKLKGKVSFIASVPDAEQRYYVSVTLNDLNTDLNKSIPYTAGLKGNAEIVTDKVPLIHKLLYSLREILHRPKKNTEPDSSTPKVLTRWQ